MKKVIAIFFLTVFWGCDSSTKFDADYYEKITHIKFPADYQVLAAGDNGEYATIAVLKLNKKTYKQFLKDNNFALYDKIYPLTFVGINFLPEEFQQIPKTAVFFERHQDKIPGKTGWTYAIDTTTRRLYCEIAYPDRGGN